MARPKKYDLDYFPVDVELINNPKLQLAINEVGSDALSVYIGVLCAIYSKSYYVPNNDPRLIVLPAKLHMPIDRFNEVYSTLLKFNLLVELTPSSDAEKEELSNTESSFVITSKGVQEQYDTSKREGLLQQELGFVLQKHELSQQERQLLQKESLKEKESKVNKNKEKVKEIVEYLNEQAGTDFQASTKCTVDHINARLNERPYTVSDFKAVIDLKVEQWLNNKDMSQYLRPKTLFSTKFEGYLQEANRASHKPQQNIIKGEFSFLEEEVLHG